MIKPRTYIYNQSLISVVFESNFFFHLKGFVLFCNIKLMRFFFTFFYVCRRKYWFRKNIWLLVFDGFTRFGMSWTRFHYFWKMSVCLSLCLFVCLSVYLSVCLCDKNFVANVTQEQLHWISWNFICNIILT